MLVPKKNGKLRLVNDYRQLNKQTVKSSWPILFIEETFDTLGGSCFFPKLIGTLDFIKYPWTGTAKTTLSIAHPLDRSNDCECQWDKLEAGALSEDLWNMP